MAGGHTNPGQAGAGQKQSSVDVDADVDVEASAIPLMHLCLAHIEKHLKLARNQGVDEVDSMRKYEIHKNCIETGEMKWRRSVLRQGSSSFSACRSPAYFIIIILQGIISFEWSFAGIFRAYHPLSLSLPGCPLCNVCVIT